MDAAILMTGFASITQSGLDERISGWKASGLGGEIDTIKLMMGANAQSTVFNILNILDGTSDIENTDDFGVFELSFESFKTKATCQITPSETNTLHDLFMESCAEKYSEIVLGDEL